MFHSQHTTNENLKLQFTTTLLISLLLQKFLKSASLSGTWASAVSPRPGTGFVVPTLHSSPTLTILSWSPPGAKPQFWAILWCSCFHLHQILLSLTGEPIPRLPQFTEIQSSKKYFLRAGRKKKKGNTAKLLASLSPFFLPFTNIKIWNKQIWTCFCQKSKWQQPVRVTSGLLRMSLINALSTKLTLSKCLIDPRDVLIQNNGPLLGKP